MAPLIVLMSSILLKFRKVAKSRSQTNQELALIQTVGSIGGLIATGVGFSLPTLYFLNPVIFNEMLKAPLYFAVFIGTLCLCAGGLGIWLARCFAQRFVKQEDLKFPVSQLIYKTITSGNQAKQAKKMFFGLGASWIFCFLRDGFLSFKGFIPKQISILPSLLGSSIIIPMVPMYWAIGFITGIKIVFPLLVGMLSKYFVLWPINNHSLYLPFNLFSVMSDVDFSTAFCSGLVVAELALGLAKYPAIFCSNLKKCSGFNVLGKIKSIKTFFAAPGKSIIGFEAVFVLSLSFAFLTYLKFNFIAQILLIAFTIAATYQLSYLGCKIGLVTFGRFATFIMIPMMLMFKLDFMQITMLCVFFNVCSAAASDLLFDYKVGQLCDISPKRIHRYQWLGLIVTALCIGFFLWLLFSNFQLGSPELFGQRGKTRALLIQSVGFNLWVLFFGFLFGWLLKKLKVSPTMVLGGILMPNSLTIGLIIGAVCSWLSKEPSEQEPAWSGIFAGESVWMLVSILTKMFL